MEENRAWIWAPVAWARSILRSARTWALGTARNRAVQGGHEEADSRPAPLSRNDAHTVPNVRGVEGGRNENQSAPTSPSSKDLYTRQVASRTAFIKLYDRRCSHELRKQNDAKPWTREIEDEFAAALQRDDICKAIEELRRGTENDESEDEDGDSGQGSSVDGAEDDDSEEDFEWTPMHSEAAAAVDSFGMWEAESTVYHRMQEYQGTHIPRVIAQVEVMSASEKPAPPLTSFDPFSIKGMMLEYCEGGALLDIVHNFPRTSWKSIMDRAMETVLLMDSKDIHKFDIRPRNFVVSLGPQEEIRTLMVDFGHCQFRRLKETDED